MRDIDRIVLIEYVMNRKSTRGRWKQDSPYDFCPPTKTQRFSYCMRESPIEIDQLLVPGKWREE